MRKEHHAGRAFVRGNDVKRTGGLTRRTTSQPEDRAAGITPRTSAVTAATLSLFSVAVVEEAARRQAPICLR